MKRTITLFLSSIFIQIGMAQVPSYVPSDGLVGWWSFNGNANDESVNGNNCTIFNGPVSCPDRFGAINSAYLLDGVDDWIETNASFLQTDNPHSISMWWKTTDSTKTNQTLFNTSPHTLENSAFHFSSSSSTPPYGMSFGMGNGLSGAGSWNIMHPDVGQITTPPTFGQWHQYVWVKDASLNWTFYFDGVLIDTFNSLTNTGSQIANLRFGAENNGVPTGGANFLGNLDDIGIWNRALTSEEIQALYNGCIVPNNAIAGDPTPSTLTSTSYSCNNNSGSNYEWTVTNGVIVSGQGTNQIEVLWSSEGSGTVSVIETNAGGCIAEPFTIDVVVIPTSIEENTQPLFQVYPNPATTNLTLTTESDLTGSEYFLTDGLGKMVLRGKIISDNTIISLEGLSKGTYRISVKGVSSSSSKSIVVR